MGHIDKTEKHQEATTQGLINQRSFANILQFIVGKHDLHL